MKKLLLILVYSLGLLEPWGAKALARNAGVLATPKFEEIMEQTQHLLSWYNPRDILFVWDIDNTLLKMDYDLGSEHWFLWQKGLIENGVSSLPSVTDSISHLLEVQSWIYEARTMSPVDRRQPFWIQTLQNQGAAVIALTSRSLNVQFPTIRELQRNQIVLTEENQIGLPRFNGAFVPYSLERPEEAGLSSKDITEWNLGTPRPVVFASGVYLTQGQHKGAMLKTLLHRMHRKFRAIVFIDDRRSHIDNMILAAETVSEDIYSIHFHYSEFWTKPFLEGSKNMVQDDWCQFAKSLKARIGSPQYEQGVFNSCIEN